MGREAEETTLDYLSAMERSTLGKKQTQIATKCTVDFVTHFLFRFETSSVYLMSRKSDILQETIDDLALKLTNYG